MNKTGDLIVQRYLSNGRWRSQRCIVLPVTKQDLREGINARHTGLYGFRGCWYGKKVHMDSFGKIEKATGKRIARFALGARLTKRLRRSL